MHEKEVIRMLNMCSWEKISKDIMKEHVFCMTSAIYKKKYRELYLVTGRDSSPELRKR